MAKARRTYPPREKSPAEKLSIVHQNHVILRDRERALADLLAAQAEGLTAAAGVLTSEPIDQAIERARRAVATQQQLVADVESQYGTLDALRGLVHER